MRKLISSILLVFLLLSNTYSIFGDDVVDNLEDEIIIENEGDIENNEDNLDNQESENNIQDLENESDEESENNEDNLEEEISEDLENENIDNNTEDLENESDEESENSEDNLEEEISEDLENNDIIEQDLEDENKENDITKFEISTASFDDLKTISGVGDKTANNIIDYFENNLVCDIDDLINVSGVGSATLENIKNKSYLNIKDECLENEYIDDDKGDIENNEDNLENELDENNEDLEEENTDIIEQDEEINEQQEEQQEINQNYPNFDINHIFQNPSYLLGREIYKYEYTCDDSYTECRVNYDLAIDEGDGFKSIGTRYECEWDFGFGIITGEELKCNPLTVTYPKGTHITNYKVWEKNNPDNLFEGNIKIIKTNNIINTTTSSNTTQTISNQQDTKTYTPTTPIITLQGTIGKNKILNGNHLLCEGKTCSVNLDGRQSTGDIESYFWDLDNGEIFKGANPPSYQYEIGEYKISLKLTGKDGSEKYEYFYVDVVESFVENDSNENNILGEVNKEEILQNYSIIISGALPNPTGVDHNEWIDIKNIGDKDVNLKGCFIDNEIGARSKSYHINEDLILKPNEVRRFYKFYTQINLRNTSGEQINIVCGGVVVDKLEWFFDTPDEFIVTPFNSDIKNQYVYIDRVIDGDTFVISFENNTKMILRHIGIDAPETKNRNKEVEAYGLEATEFAIQNLDKKRVFLEIQDKIYIDKYGRLLGYIVIDNKDFGELILERGLAKVYNVFEFSKYDTYNKSQEIAKKNKVGIWSSTTNNFENIDLGEKQFSYFLEEEFYEYNPDDIISLIMGDREFDDENSLNNKENISDFLDKSFYQQVSKLKKGVRIYGKTIPNTKVIINLQNKEISFLNRFFPKVYASVFYETISDKNGLYELIIEDFLMGEYEISSFLDISGDLYKIKSTNFFEIDKEYYEEFYLNKSKKDISTIKQEPKNEDLILIPKITLQGRIAQTNIVNGNTITCHEKDECSVNFDGRDSIGNIKNYFWDFGNGQTFDKANPPSLKFTRGYYRVSLNVSNDYTSSVSYFIVDVRGKEEKLSLSGINEVGNINTNFKSGFNEPLNINIQTAINSEKNNELIHILILFFISILVIFLSTILLKRAEMI